ncbi:MAG: efflux RND transporter periplasmic adaptor subunit [Chloroflexi bacterium]|nr:efflux RND transporter periplasmic adaptor subunit [Chloroflexota bacterium]
MNIQRTLILIGAFFIAVVAGKVGYERIVGSQAQMAAAAAARNQIVQVQRGNLVATVNTTGPIVAVNQAKLSFKTGGRLKSVNVGVGDVVKAGDVLARLETQDLELQLVQAQATLETNQIKLAQAKAGPKPEDIVIAKSALEKAAISLQKAQADYDKVSWMSGIGAMPQSVALQQASLDYQTALANYAKATAGTPTDDIRVLENTVKNSQAALELVRLNLANASLVAPFDGIVASVGANPGEQVGGGTPMFTLINLSKLRIDANVDETEISKVNLGQEVSITLDALPNVRLQGKVISVAPGATVQSGVVTYLVQIGIVSADAQVMTGMTANANIVVEQKTNVLYVPNRAIKVNRNLRTVQVMENGQLVEKQIRTGMSNDQFTEVTEGLKEGEEVVIVTTATNRPLTGGASRLFGGMPPSGGGFMMR